MLKLYSNIKKHRQKLNMSQQALAEAVGYKGKSMIAQVENGKVDLPTSMITKFAEVFGCSEDELMGIEITNSALVETEPGTAYVLPLHGINSEDRKLLDQYHNVSPETRAAIDLLLKADQQKP